VIFTVSGKSICGQLMISYYQEGAFMSKVVHFEITGTEPEEVIDFYAEVFGWEFTRWDVPFPYWMINTGDPDSPGIDGGLTERGGFGSNTVNTIDVEDIDSAIEKVKEHGGEIMMPKTAVNGVGWIGYFKDPFDNIFGLMQTDENAR
jgi:predicted enzyme related to lactoylglutathione lyase